MAFSLFKKNSILVVVPPERTPSLHRVWYHLQALGDVDVQTISHHGQKMYRVTIVMETGNKIAEQDPDLYAALTRIYHFVKVILRRKLENK